jgi:hypothetical protein
MQRSSGRNTPAGNLVLIERETASMGIVTEQNRLAQEIHSSESDLPRNIHCRRDQAWDNWGRTAHCQPEFSFYPERVEELIEIVNFARARG